MRLCRLLDIKHLDYCEALTLMRGLVEAKRRSPGPEVLMLLEHEPVVTMGRRADEGEIAASIQRLRGQRPAVHHIERGG
ncbi:MAG: octanoyltransferase, partial [Thermodesulfobacteriota bacterium]|nr:octanoyltransferase [Thermodesulfobacteriota bacterium]